MVDPFITDENGKVIATCKKRSYLHPEFEEAPLTQEILRDLEKTSKKKSKSKSICTEITDALFRFIFLPPIAEFGDVIKVKGCKKSYHFDFKETSV